MSVWVALLPSWAWFGNSRQTRPQSGCLGLGLRKSFIEPSIWLLPFCCFDALPTPKIVGPPWQKSRGSLLNPVRPGSFCEPETRDAHHPVIIAAAQSADSWRTCRDGSY